MPVVAAVNGPAVGLGCSLVALSDIVFMAESAHLADPHVMVGLVAADGGPVTWPLLTSLQLAKEYALTGDRIPAERAAEIGLVNHVVPRRRGARPGAGLRPPHRQAAAAGASRTPSASSTSTSSGPSLATLDFALTAEDRSFDSPELRANLDRLLAPRPDVALPSYRGPSRTCERAASSVSEGEERGELAGGEQLVAQRAGERAGRAEQLVEHEDAAEVEVEGRARW